MAQILMLDARPEPIAIHPPTAAVIVVDMQNDWSSELLPRDTIPRQACLLGT